MVLQLVLKSGSIKDLAAAYSVSYPTMRGRLDRVIERLQAVVNRRPIDPLADLIADLVGRGELSPSAGRAILETAKKSKGGGL